MTRILPRAAVMLVAAAVLLPAGAAHAVLPVDVGGGRTSAAPASSAADDDSGDDEIGDDDTAATDDDSTVDDEDTDSIADERSADDDTGSSSTRAGGSTSSGGSAARSRSVKRPGTPRGVDAYLSAFDRAVVTFRPGAGARITRWIVTLRSGRTGRLMILGPRARSATFTALKPSTRYTATVTAIAASRRASVTDHVRTTSLRKAIRKAQNEADRAARQTKSEHLG